MQVPGRPFSSKRPPDRCPAGGDGEVYEEESFEVFYGARNTSIDLRRKQAPARNNEDGLFRESEGTIPCPLTLAERLEKLGCVKHAWLDLGCPGLPKSEAGQQQEPGAEQEQGTRLWGRRQGSCSWPVVTIGDRIIVVIVPIISPVEVSAVAVVAVGEDIELVVADGKQ